MWREKVDFVKNECKWGEIMTGPRYNHPCWQSPTTHRWYPLHARALPTGGRGTLTQWVHCEFVVSFEAICPVITQQVCGEFFWKVPTKVPSGYFLNESPEFVSKEPSKLPSRYFLNKHSEFFQKVPINLIKMYPTIYLAGSLWVCGITGPYWEFIMGTFKRTC